MLVARMLSLVLPLCLPALLLAQGPPELTLPAESTPVLYATGMAPASSVAFDHECTTYLANYRREGVVGRIQHDGTAGVLCDLAEAAPLENRTPSIACLRVDVEGRVIVADAGGGRLLRISHDGSRVEVLADRYDGERFSAIEAVALDRLGDIYFTDSGPTTPATEGAEDPADTATGVLYRFDVQTNKVTELDRDLLAPGGLAIAPDQLQLVVAESAADRLLAYSLNVQGEVGERHVLLEFEAVAMAEQGEDTPAGPLNPVPRGMAFDTAGRLFVALAGTGQVAVIDAATGQQLMAYEIGGRGISDCHFHAGDLYIAIAPKEAVFRLPLGIEGFDYCGQ